VVPSSTRELAACDDADWPSRPLRERLRVLAAVRRRLAEHRDSQCALMEAEVGKPPFEAFTADILPVLTACRWHEKHAARVLAPRRLTGGGLATMGQSHRRTRVPLGRVGIIATWNYPVGLLGVQLVQALAAGNEVVVKPSEHTPRTQRALVEHFRAAGVPASALAILPADRDAGRAMLAGEPGFGGENGFDKVVFTGSTRVGRAIAEVLAPSLTPSTLELSGRDSAFVLADADPRLAARSIWWAATVNAGQTCMAPKRALVDRAVYPAFVRALLPLASGARPRRLISAEAARAAFDEASAAVAAGGRSASGVLEPPEGPWLRPLAILDCPEDADLVAGRCFAPVLAVVPVDSLDHALAVHARVDQTLATSVFTRRPRSARADLAPRLGSTTVTINDCVLPTAHPATSIGGVGASGWGVSRGREGLLAMTRPVFVSTTGRLRPPLDEPAPEQARRLVSWMARLVGGARATAEPSAAAASAANDPSEPTPAPARPGDAAPRESAR
jgi:aldehyde dehydrogenase (NAD+)